MEKKIEKQKMFKEVIEYYNEAMSKKMYLAAILLDYDLLEDRLDSFIRRLQLLNNRKKLKEFVKTIIQSPTEKITDMSCKIDLVRQTIKWHENVENVEGENSEVAILRRSLENIDTGAILELLSQLDEWRKERNDLIHNLMKLDSGALNEEKLGKIATTGFKIFRVLDGEVARIKE